MQLSLKGPPTPPSNTPPIALTLLTRSETFYTSRRLLEAARTRGFVATWLDSGTHPAEAVERLRSRHPAGALPDVVLPRIGSRCTSQELSLLAALTDEGIFSPASPEALHVAMDKAETHARLEALGLPVVPSGLASSTAQAREAARVLGEGPWVIKPRFGSQGRDVLRGDTLDAIEAAAGDVLARNDEAVIQPLVQMTPARDLRVLIIDGEARAGCWRIAASGEFRSNVHLGATTEAATLEPEVATLASAAAEALGLAHAGVDLLPTAAGGFQILEVNGSPGLEGIESATGRDLADEVLDWVGRALSRRPATSSRGAPRSERSRSPCPPTYRP